MGLFVFVAFGFVIGLYLIVGGFRKSKWLTDPADEDICNLPLGLLHAIFPPRLIPIVAVVTGLLDWAVCLFVIFRQLHPA